MYMYICIYEYMYIGRCAVAYISACMDINTHITHWHMYGCMHICERVYVFIHKCMYVGVYMYIRNYIYAWIHTCIYVYMYTDMHWDILFVCLYKNTHISDVYLCIHVCYIKVCIQTDMHEPVCIYAYISVWIYSHTCIYAYMYTHDIYAYIHV